MEDMIATSSSGQLMMPASPPMVPASLGAGGSPAPSPSGGFFSSWERVALVALGGAAVVASGLLLVQWRHAVVGRRVSRDVVDFLKHHGAAIDGEFIVGGPVSVPMKVDAAVVGTVDTLLRDITRHAASAAPAKDDRRQGAQSSGDEAAVAAAAVGSRAHRPKKGSRVGASAPPAATREEGGRPKFPEPMLSGKTGLPVAAREEDEDGGEDGPRSLPPSLNEPQGGRGQGGGGSHSDQENDFSYQPPMPPGMKPPANIP
jgi:hypothetical protein